MDNACEKHEKHLKLLFTIFDFFNKEYFENALSIPVIASLPDEGKQQGRVLGWYTKREVWHDKDGESAHELNISCNYTDCSLEDIAAVMLHEMVHQYAGENELKDTSRAGTYHNKVFAKIASEHGLKVKKSKKYGFSETDLTPEAKQKIKNLFKNEDSLLYRRQVFDEEEILELIEKEVPPDTPDRKNVIQEMMQGVKEGKYQIQENGIKQKKSSTRKYVCPCCGMSVRATKVVNIKCGDCDITMRQASAESIEGRSTQISA